MTGLADVERARRRWRSLAGLDDTGRKVPGAGNVAEWVARAEDTTRWMHEPEPAGGLAMSTSTLMTVWGLGRSGIEQRFVRSRGRDVGTEPSPSSFVRSILATDPPKAVRRCREGLDAAGDRVAAARTDYHLTVLSYAATVGHNRTVCEQLGVSQPTLSSVLRAARDELRRRGHPAEVWSTAHDAEQGEYYTEALRTSAQLAAVATEEF